jgi:F0F1-type ATP synthase epsilon subunit
MKNGTFERFIERIGQLSSEKKRVKVVLSQVKNEDDFEEKDINENASKSMLKKKKKKDDQKDKKRKGVGYTTG